MMLHINYHFIPTGGCSGQLPVNKGGRWWRWRNERSKDELKWCFRSLGGRCFSDNMHNIMHNGGVTSSISTKSTPAPQQVFKATLSTDPMTGTCFLQMETHVNTSGLIKVPQTPTSGNSLLGWQTGWGATLLPVSTRFSCVVGYYNWKTLVDTSLRHLRLSMDILMLQISQGTGWHDCEENNLTARRRTSSFNKTQCTAPLFKKVTIFPLQIICSCFFFQKQIQFALLFLPSVSPDPY